MSEEMAAQYGFALFVRAAGLVFFSGVVGYDENGGTPTDPETQYRLAFSALREVLASEGCEPADLVELSTFHVDYPRHGEIFAKVKGEFLEGATPTWTAIGAHTLRTPETLVKIKAIAQAN